MPHIRRKQHQAPGFGLYAVPRGKGRPEIGGRLAKFDPALLLGAIFHHLRYGHVIAGAYPTIGVQALLRNADLIQMDFADFRPLRWFRCVSSLFLHPQFRARPVPGAALPVTPLGGKNMATGNNWDAVV